MDVYIFLFYLAITLFFGFILGKLAERIKIPAITGYILAGVLLGPSVLNVLDETIITNLDVITNFVLGIIAYQIGTELWLPKVKKSGKSIIIITAVQAFLTAALVFAGIYFIDPQHRLWLALTLAAIATATAPAPIMVMVKRMKAKGPVTDTVIPVVGIDDIFGVIVFGLFTSIAAATIGGGSLTVETALLEPLLEVFLSLLVGSIFGLALGLFSKLFVDKIHKMDRYISYLVFSLSAVLVSVYIAHHGLHFGFIEIESLSMILTPMMIGMVFTNMVKKEPFEIQGAALSNFSGPLIIVFFTLAGAQLRLDVLISAGFIAILYIVFRSIGKVGGAYAGAVIAKSEKVVRDNTGLCILPQGGVEIGMLVAVGSIFAGQTLADGSSVALYIRTIVLTGILFFEIVGPIIFKWRIEKIGESHDHIKFGDVTHGDMMEAESHFKEMNEELNKEK
ncbi:cation:proton antiporter [Mycoplasmatota bacterium]|nr:cation:proton antiporter [Mycoplasmatota bacterium]